MKRHIFLAILATALSPALGNAEESKLLVRLRGVNIQPADKSDAIPSLRVPADAIHVSSKTIPEVDFTYFLSKNVAAELILTYPQKHDVDISGTKIGSFKHLPPVLTFQYHFVPEGQFRPYIGVGANLTLISNVALAVPGVGALDLENYSVGVAGQAGFDLKVDEKVFLNVDAKYVTLSSDVMLKANGAKVSAVKVSPWLIGFGIGYRF